jgi:hypothetical protein
VLGQFGDPTAHVNAAQTAAGLEGGFWITYPDGTFAAGSATCLTVSGRTAYVTSQITSSGGPRQQTNDWILGSYIVIGVQDHGRPRAAGPDLMNFSPGSATDPGCGPDGAAKPVFPITAGNYKVFGISWRLSGAHRMSGSAVPGYIGTRSSGAGGGASL